MGDQAEQLIELALLDRVKGVTMLAQNLDLAFDENALEEEFVTAGTAVLLKSDSHNWRVTQHLVVTYKVYHKMLLIEGRAVYNDRRPCIYGIF